MTSKTLNTEQSEALPPVAPVRMSRFLILETLVFLLPTTLVNIVMAVMAASSVSNASGLLFFAALFGLIGFALFSVWWLLLQHSHYASLKLIPKWLWGGLLVGAMFVLLAPLWIGFVESSSSQSWTEMLGALVFFVLLAAVCALPFCLPRAAFLWGRAALWLVFVLPIGLMMSGVTERFTGMALTSMLSALALGPLILSAILLAIIRHRASEILELPALSES